MPSWNTRCIEISENGALLCCVVPVRSPPRTQLLMADIDSRLLLLMRQRNLRKQLQIDHHV